MLLFPLSIRPFLNSIEEGGFLRCQSLVLLVCLLRVAPLRPCLMGAGSWLAGGLVVCSVLLQWLFAWPRRRRQNIVCCSFTCVSGKGVSLSTSCFCVVTAMYTHGIWVGVARSCYLQRLGRAKSWWELTLCGRGHLRASGGRRSTFFSKLRYARCILFWSTISNLT